MNTLYALNLVLFVEQLLDWITTRTIMTNGSGHEGDPVSAWLMGKLTMDGFLAAKTLVVTAIGYWTGTESLVVPEFIIMVYAIVILSNVTLIVTGRGIIERVIAVFKK